MIKKAKKCGLEAIAITDHNKLFSHRKARELSKQYNIMILPGIELGKLGYLKHVLAINIEKIPPYFDTHEILEFINDEGGLSIAPHPFSKLGYSDYYKYRFHAVEKINGVNWICNLRFKSSNDVPKLGSSDAHAQYMLGYTYTQTEHAETPEQLLEQIRKGICQPKGHAVPTHLTMRLGLTLSLRHLPQYMIKLQKKGLEYEDTLYSNYRGIWTRS
jgi:predicted metal-dependent phosphoesterase TrpH